jgi:hypothetical protein
MPLRIGQLPKSSSYKEFFLMDDNSISEKTLRMMNKATMNLRDGKAGKPIDFDKMKELAESLEDDE